VTRSPFTGRPRKQTLGPAVESESARDVRRFADQELDVESEVWDLREIALEHCSIAGEAERPAVMVGVVIDELMQIGPVLPVQAADIVLVEVGEGGFGHRDRPGGLERNIDLTTFRLGARPASLAIWGHSTL
jgi:hypothetical protein